MTERIAEIEARAKAASPGPDLQEIKARADFATKNYSRLGSSWAEFYGRDIPYLLAQLREAQRKLGVVEKASVSYGYSQAKEFMDAIDRILHPQEGGE